MKLNKKGYMLVEIIVAFSIAMAMLYFLMNIVIKMKDINEDFYVDTKLETDQLLMTKLIEDDISKHSLKSINTATNEENIKEINLVFENDLTKRITIKKEGNTTYFAYGELNDDNTYNEALKFSKIFDENLSFGNIVLEDKCYKENDTYTTVDCRENDKYKMLNFNIPAYVPYSDKNYGLNINLYYNYDEIKLVNKYVATFTKKGNIKNIEAPEELEGQTSNCDGNTCIISCITENDSCEINLPIIEDDDYYNFDGWYLGDFKEIEANQKIFTLDISNNNNTYETKVNEKLFTYKMTFIDTNNSSTTRDCIVSVSNNSCTLTTPTITYSAGTIPDGWYTLASGGEKLANSNQSITINNPTGDTIYYARTKADPCANTDPIKYTCSNSASCSVSNSNKILKIKGNTNLEIINNTQCSNRKIGIALVGGGDGGMPGTSKNYIAGNGGDGGYILQNDNFTMSFNTTYSITIGAGGLSNREGSASTLKKGSEIVLTSENGEQIKYNSCTRSCYKTIYFAGVDYGNYGSPGIAGKKGGYYEGYYAAKPTDGTNGSNNTGNGGNGGDGNVTGLIRKCGTGNCNSSNNVHYSYPAGKGGTGGSGIIILYSSNGWTT